MVKTNEQPQDNLRYYEQLRKVPKEALKQIKGGRLSGMSDINPMFRIKAMTSAFGPCGIGWKYEITKQWHESFDYEATAYEVENGMSVAKKVTRKEIKAFCNINLYVKVTDEWSDAIPGLGGSTVMTYEKNGYYVSDEADKMALTDALGVAMKALGVAADVYWEKGQFDSKYEQDAYLAQQGQAQQQQQAVQQQQQQAVQQLQQQAVQQLQQQYAPQPQMQQTVQQVNPQQILAEINAAQSDEQLREIWKKYPRWQRDANFTGAMTARKDQLKNNGKS